jgi:ABC-type glycerol-3-phosphate transport system substrate-binding protein
MRPSRLATARLATPGKSVAAAASVASPPAWAQSTVTLWSHWADQASNVAFVKKAAKTFEAKRALAQSEPSPCVGGGIR